MRNYFQTEKLQWCEFVVVEKIVKIKMDLFIFGGKYEYE